MKSDNSLSMGFGNFLSDSLDIASVSLLSIARKLGIDAQQVHYWRDKGQAPDRLLRLLVALRHATGESWDDFGTRLEDEFSSKKAK